MDIFLQNRESIAAARDYVYLDTSTTGPFHKRVLKALHTFYEHRYVYGGSLRDYKGWMKRANEVRELVAILLGAWQEEIIFVPNASTGINIGAHMIPFQEDHEVLVPDISFPSGSYAFENLSSRGVVVRSVETREGALTYEDLIENVNEKTKAISLSQVEFSSGFRHDVERIGEYSAKKGIYLLVDGTQGIGAMQLHVKREKVPLLAFSPYKWLCAPLGIGILYAREDLIKKSHPTYVGWFGVEDPFSFSTKPHLSKTGSRFEPGGLNYSAIMALGEMVKIHLEIGIGAIEERILALMEYLIEGLLEIGVEMVGPFDPKNRSGILLLRLKGEELERVREVFDREGIRVSYGQETIRLGVHYFNTEEDLEHFFKYLKRGLEGRPSL